MTVLTNPMLVRLRDELAGDPAGRGYAGQSAQAKADLVNAPFTVTGPPGVQDVPVGAVEGYLRSRMVLGGLQRFVSAPPVGAPGALVEGLTELLGLVLSPHVATVQMTDATVAAAVHAVLAATVAGGLMTAQQQTELLAMTIRPGDVVQFHARVLDVFMGINAAPNEVTADDVAAAVAA